MLRQSQPALVALSVIFGLCPIMGAAEEYIVDVGHEQIRFVARKDLGYMVKSSGEKPATLLSRNASLGIASEGVKYLNIAARPDMLVVLDQQPPSQSESSIRILSEQPDVEYVAPLFSLDGETVAVIPEIIVRLRQETDRAKLEDLCRQTGCTIIRNLLYTKLEFLIAPTARDAEQVLTTVEVLSKAGFVEWAFPNLAFQPKLLGSSATNEPNNPKRVEPNDTYFDKQWHLETIHAPEAWAYTTGDPKIIVAVLDDGVDINHPDLANNIWVNAKEIPGNGIDDDGNGKVDDVHGWDFVDEDGDVNPAGDNAHGTACAGLIAAQGNDDVGVTGVTWNCTIMPVRIIGNVASNLCTLTEPVDGLMYAAAQDADVISNSWTMPDCPLVRSAIQAITRSRGKGRNGKGCVVLFASGNNGRSVTVTASYPEVIAVGAIDHEDKVWGYSARGPELDIVAPSGKTDNEGDIYTTDLVEGGYSRYNHDSTLDKNYTDTFGGTSAACPIAAGVAALVLSINPNLDRTEVRRILLRSATDLGPQGWDEKYGFGRVDAYAAVAMALNPPPGLTLFVDDNAPSDPGRDDPNVSDPLEDGSAEHPFDAIQEAISALNTIDGDVVVVLPGTYTGKGNRDINFHGKAITVRSKDGPDTCIIDCQKLSMGFYFCSGEGPNSVVEGFTVVNGSPDGYGCMYNSHSSPTVTDCNFSGNYCAGMFNTNSSSPTVTNCNFVGNYRGGMRNTNSSSPTVTDCNFSGNSVLDDGGGMYNSWSNPIVTYCTFSGNSTGASRGGRGGGMYNEQSDPSITDCTFRGNSADFRGGGMYNSQSNPIVTYCSFSANSTGAIGTGRGGGMYNWQSSSTVTNCSFIGNSARGSYLHWGGGGMYNEQSDPNITDCTFRGNSADHGGGMYNDGSNPTFVNCTLADNLSSHGRALACASSPMVPSTIKIVNCILWNGENETWNNDNSTITINYSDVTEVWPGIGNISVDPLFADPANGDYRLKSQAGRWDPANQSWVRDDITSPCIDAGDPNSPVEDEPQPNGGRINMGADGGTPEASKSPAPAPGK